MNDAVDARGPEDRKCSNPLVIATGASHGGARAILLGLLDNLPNKKYVVACPFTATLIEKYPNVEFIELETRGIFSVLFAVFLSKRVAAKHGCDGIVSLMNIGPIFYSKKTIVYFHLSTEFAIKTMIYRFFLKISSVKPLIVCQSLFMRRRIEQLLPNFEVCCAWPGLNRRLAEIQVAPLSFQGIAPFILLPLSNHSSYKNLSSVIALRDFFVRRNIRVVVTGGTMSESDGPFYWTGYVSHEMSSLMNEAEAIIFPSLIETFGLPVVEFLQTGKPAFVLKRPYNENLFDRFMPLDNLFFYDDSPEKAIDDWIAAGKKTLPQRPDLSEGDWSWLP